MEVFENETRVRVCLEHNRKCEEEFTVQIGNRPHSNRSASKGHIFYDVIRIMYTCIKKTRTPNTTTLYYTHSTYVHMKSYKILQSHSRSLQCNLGSPDDYQDGPYEVFFGEGEKVACIDIPVIDDGVEEGPERFQLQIMPPDNGGVPFVPGSNSMAQITIQDGENSIL